jgi:hypothetical protein
MKGETPVPAGEVVLSVTADGWNRWGERFVKRQPLRRQQRTIGPSPSVSDAKNAVVNAIRAAGAGGTVIINVGHGGGGGNLRPTEGKFELAPGGVMRIGGRLVANTFVDVFYDVRYGGPSDMENDLKNNPKSPRLTNWRIYQEIAQAFKATRTYEVILLTCRVGNATEFLQKVANDWGVIITAFRQRVVLTEDVTTVGRQVTRRFFMHLENNPPAGKSAAVLIIMEEETPYGMAPYADIFRVGPPLPVMVTTPG